MNFAQNLSDLMRSGNLTSYRLGKETGISNRLIDYWKKGEKVPNVANLEKLASYFQVSVDYLLGIKREEKLCVPFSSIRNYLGLSAKEMAKFLDRDLMTIYRWEQLSEVPDEESLNKIALKLHTSVNVLLGKDPKESISVDSDGNLSFETHGYVGTFFLDSNDNTVKKEKPALTKKDEPDITFNDFTYALHNETKELTEENKQKLLEMARFFKEQQDKEKNR